MKKPLTTLVAAVCFSTNTLLAEVISGSWMGTLELGIAKLRLVVHVAQDGSCSLDSPDQGANGIPASIVSRTVDSLEIKVPSIGASYSGRLKNGVLQGTFVQRGMKFPLELKSGVSTVNRPQTPKPPFPYSTEEVSFTNKNAHAKLAGTLSVPAKATCAILMVTGSGQQNRDEELFEHKPFAVIADHLARRGIATLRYDDRATAKSIGGNLKTATTRDFADDAAAGIAWLRATGRFRKVGIIGHSEGSMIAFMLGAKNKLDFIVSLAGPAVRGDALLLEQHKAILGDAAKNLTIKQVRDSPATSKNAWYRFFMDYDPQSDIRNITCPTLILNGEKDCQVVASQNLAAFRRNLPSHSMNIVKCYPNLNHLFQHCQTGLPAEYGEIEETFSEEVLNDIADWLLKVSR